MKKIILLIILNSFTNLFSQNLTLNETMDYINEELTKNNPREQYSQKSKFVLIENGDIARFRYYKGNLEFIQRINLYDIETVTITERSEINVELKCYNEKKCATWEYLDERSNMNSSWEYINFSVKNTRSGNKIKKAIEYFIKKAKEQNFGKNDDPFDTFETEKEKNTSINIMDLKIGMAKKEVFKILNTKPEVELIETDYEVYRARKQNLYFLYFSNGKLIRVDKGVRRADARIIIE